MRLLTLFSIYLIVIIFSSTVYGAVAEVPRTGQDTCYDEQNGSVISCPGSGQDGALVAGIAIPSPRFTDNGDNTVTDVLTELIWLKNPICMQTHYPEFDNDDTAGDGKVNWQHALDFITGINASTYPDCGAGFTDWRLPNVRELESLMNLQYSQPALSNTAGDARWTANDPFSNGFSNELYWTGSTAADYKPHFAWAVSLWEGFITHASYKDSSYFDIWPVRGGQ